jgi:hypothetical protein
MPDGIGVMVSIDDTPSDDQPFDDLPLAISH